MEIVVGWGLLVIGSVVGLLAGALLAIAGLHEREERIRQSVIQDWRGTCREVMAGIWKRSE